MKKVISKDGTSISYDRFGAGEPVILVDGALCSRAFGPMSKLALLLASQFTVIHYDRRGRNDSGNTLPYAVEREIEDLEALIREVGGSVFVYGISSGAALALAAAASGLNIKKLVLYEPPFMVDEKGHLPPKDAGEQLKSMIAANRRGDAVKFFMKDMMGVPSPFVFMMRLMPMWSKLKAVADTLPYDAAIMGDFSLPAARAASVRIPTLVAGGEKSPATLRHAVERIAAILPNKELQLLKGQNHNVSMNVLAPVLTRFFQGDGGLR